MDNVTIEQRRRSKLLTVAEVALMLRVSKMTVYRLVHSGELASIQVGSSFRVPEHAVTELLGEPYGEDFFA